MVKLHLISLGCAKNLVDSEKILGRLGACGITVTDSLHDSDAVILNTCGFIGPALRETENTIRRLRPFSGAKKIYVHGCAVTRALDALRMKFPWVDGWSRLGQESALIKKLAGDAKPMYPRLVTTGGYAYLKIADGCSNRCAYCTIPMIKGRFRSVARTRLIDEARELARLGTKEIVLIAQDTAGYGVDLYGKPMIVDLVSDLSGIEGVRWIRLMYAHPKSLSEDLVREIGRNPRVCKYLDMPIQHISDRLLRLMNRHVSRRRIELLVRMLRSVPGMTLRTTVIAGFPTETAAEFRELHSFLEKGYFDWFGVFPYCREKGTPAADLAQNSAAEIRRRCKALASLQRGIIREKNRLRLNNVYMTLVHRHNGGYIGHTEFSAPQTDGSVHIQGTNVRIGDFCDIRIRRTKGSELYGDIA